MRHERSRDGRRFGRYVGAACGVALLVGAAAPATAQTPAGPTQNAFAGAQVFGAKGCVKCHAIRGLGGAEAPDLGLPSEARTFHDLAAHMWNHAPRMVERMEELGVQRPRMTAQETADLIAFLFTLDYFDPPGDPDRGRELFSDKRCVMCHQVHGVGGVIGPNLEFVSYFGSPIQVAAAMWNHGPKMTEAMQAAGIERPTLTGRELIDLISYLETAAREWPEGPLHVLPGQADQGRRTIVEKGCTDCHSVRGRGGRLRLGPDLAGGSRKSLTEFAAGMLNKAPAMIAALQRQGKSVPELSPTEMADIVAYLYSVEYFAESGDARSGRQRLRRSGCLDCHAFEGGGGSSAGDLAQIRGFDTSAGIVAALWNHNQLIDQGDGTWEDWPILTTEAMADLIAFLGSLGVPR